jgi:MarR family transcriptional regulator, lower aerobic nicotinate degradation pathway regulator
MVSGDSQFHPALARNTGFLLTKAATVGRRRFAERMAGVGLDTRTWGVLNVLDAEGPVTQQALGRGAGIDPSSMVATIDELEANGLVERRPHPSDRRAHALYVTDAGRAKLAEARLLASREQDELLAGLDSAERDELHRLLLKLVSAL